jgi:hypothetical protein
MGAKRIDLDQVPPAAGSAPSLLAGGLSLAAAATGAIEAAFFVFLQTFMRL